MEQNHKPEKQAIVQYFNGNYLPFYERYLPDVKKVGKEHKAVCPLHDDTNPSLSINIETGQFHCFGCEVGGDIFTFHAKLRGFSLNGDFPKVCQGIANEFDIPVNSSHASTSNKRATGDSGKKGNIVATYDYIYPFTDDDSQLVFQKVRTEPKGFYIRRPGINGGWKYGMGNIKILYRLPDIENADEVCITEGEKDADNLAKLGFTATTNVDGAGKWLDEYNEVLEGKRINIFYDNDKQGRKHGQLVAENLHGIAESIKIIELPDLNEKEDVSDFIARFDHPETAAERISILIENTPEYEPPEFELLRSEKFEFHHVSEVLSILKPPCWRIQDITEDGTLGQHYGDSGTFKTFVALDRYLHIATGRDYHGHSVEQGTCFYICGEGQQGIGRRIKAWCDYYGVNPKDVPLFVAKTVTDLMDPEALDNVKKAIEKMASKYGDPVAVFYDTLARNFGAGDENRTQDMSTAINNLTTTFGNSMIQEVAQHKGHMNKDRARGSIALHAAVDHEYEYDLQRDGKILVKCRKMKDAPLAPPMLFTPKEINLQIDNEQFTSFVLELNSQGLDVNLAADIEKTGNSKNMQKAFKVLQQMYSECEKNLARDGREGTTPHISESEWEKMCLGKKIYSRKYSFQRGAKSLFHKGCTVYDKARYHVYPIEIYKKYEIQQ
jgi:5S rRNA maturation endonuclease (ribonuclease M5)